MKLVGILIVAGTIVVNASTFSQNVRLDLKMENVSLKSVLNEIEEKTDYYFFYKNEEIENQKNITINAKHEPLSSILNDVLKEKELGYVMFDRYILIQKIEDGYFSSAQQLTIKGKVIDLNGTPLPGVNVVEKGTTNGAVTNLDGDYTISVTSPDAILSFSFVGYLTEEIELNGQTTLNITLVEDIKTLEEVVVIGYGSQKKVNLTGAVGVVDNEELRSRPVQNTAQILQGLVPGLNIAQTQGGSLDSDPEINIRGIATIGEGSTGSPLILIDGMEGDINALNPQDIESVSVLKDAAASSIYGSRAPFGVILITTKHGENGRVTVNYNNSLRWNHPMNVPDMMDSYTFATYFNEASINAGTTGYFSEERLQRIQDYQNGIISYGTVEDPSNTAIWGNGYRVGNDNIDWYDEFYRNYSFSQEHNISASGGNEKMQYYFSGNYLDQGGLLEFSQDDFNRYATTLKVKGQLNKWLSVDVTNRFVRENYERPSYLTNAFYRDLARQGWPTISLYDPNGYLFNSWVINLKDGGSDEIQRDWLYQQIKFELEPIKDWKTHLELNYRTRNNLRHWDTQKTYMYNVEGNPYYVNNSTEVYEYSMRQNFLTTNIYSEYEKHLDSGHNFKGLIGFQAEESRYSDLSGKRNGIIVSSLPVINLTSGTDANGNTVSPSVTGYSDSWSTAGFFGRINYDYKGRYLLEGNLRYDGTSRYREDMRWNWFPSMSIGWNIARENFWQPLESTISMLKIRTSYGELGNQNTSSIYPTYLTMTTGTANGGWLINGAKSNTAEAPGIISQSLTWEKIHSWNLGLDLGVFNNRLNASFDYFTRKTFDMIGPAPELPLTLGTDVPTTNNTDLKTYGFELSLSWRDLLDNGLGYSVQFLLSDSQTEITRYPNETRTLYDSEEDEFLYRSNMMTGEIWGYETVGIAKTQEEMDAHLASLPNGGQDAIGSQWEAGDIMYKDINGDGKIDNGSSTEENHGDWKIIGNETPRYLFSLNLSANWKGIDISTLFQGVMKRDYFQDSYYFWGAYSWGMWWSTGFEEHKDFFRDENSYSYDLLGENTDAYYPRPVFSSKNQQTQTRYLQDASYIRLKNLQIGYTIPSRLTEKFVVNQLRVFISGENLWTATKMTKIFDPESVEAGKLEDNGVGYGGNTYPLSKVFSVGLNVNF